TACCANHPTTQDRTGVSCGSQSALGLGCDQDRRLSSSPPGTVRELSRAGFDYLNQVSRKFFGPGAARWSGDASLTQFIRNVFIRQPGVNKSTDQWRYSPNVHSSYFELSLPAYRMLCGNEFPRFWVTRQASVLRDHRLLKTTFALIHRTLLAHPT